MAHDWIGTLIALGGLAVLAWTLKGYADRSLDQHNAEAERPRPPPARPARPGRSQNFSLTLSPRFWIKAQAVAAQAALVARQHQAKTLDPGMAGFIDTLRQGWKLRMMKADGDQPLDVRLQAFMLAAPMASMLDQAERGLAPLKVSEIWLCLFAAVLIAKTHTHQELAIAIRRLEERAAERG